MVSGQSFEESPCDWTVPLHGALGAGQVIALRDQLLLPRQIVPPVVSLKAALPRFAGGIVTVLSSGIELSRAARFDYSHGDTTFRETRRQMTVSSLAASAGLAAGSVAAGGATAALVVGAPTMLVTGLTIAGIAAAGMASSYAYEWASERVADWIP